MYAVAHMRACAAEAQRDFSIAPLLRPALYCLLSYFLRLGRYDRLTPKGMYRSNKISSVLCVF